ncbi:hypothetical protein O181_037633 [Austropuccinia psidii MF-1]|uniref:DUF4939 domain-containing protein n=1 Tax=Austropuccinia psidii MF-1 TaxID=1389203 RepID=A0A9Q3HAA5_9BASI|nr:hypothetical protein [Austropuccinia psidii MF-1]
MPIQHLPSERPTGSQARAQATLTPTPRAPLYFTPSVPQLSQIWERISRTTLRGPSKDDTEEENSVKEEESDGTEGVPAPLGASQGNGGETLSQSTKPLSHQSEPSLLAIMQQMTQIMANIQADFPSEASRPPVFNNSSMRAPEGFDGTQIFKVRSFIHSCKLIFHNDKANFSEYKKKVLYVTSFIIGSAAKWIEP